MVRAAALIAALSLAAPAHAAGNTTVFRTGNDLLPLCRELQGDEIATCYGYLQGVIDGQSSGLVRATNYCLVAGVTGRQIRDIVVAYLEAHPENRHQRGAWLVTYALNDAFPCPRPAPSSPQLEAR